MAGFWLGSARFLGDRSLRFAVRMAISGRPWRRLVRPAPKGAGLAPPIGPGSPSLRSGNEKRIDSSKALVYPLFVGLVASLSSTEGPERKFSLFVKLEKA